MQIRCKFTIRSKLKKNSYAGTPVTNPACTRNISQFLVACIFQFSVVTSLCISFVATLTALTWLRLRQLRHNCYVFNRVTGVIFPIEELLLYIIYV